MNQQREFFRIRYTSSEYPTLELSQGTGVVKCPIVDLSASGVNIQIPRDQYLPQQGEVLRGTIRFKNSQKISVQGTVVRVDQKQRQVAFKLIDEIEMKLLMEQHRLWINRCKMM